MFRLSSSSSSVQCVVPRSFRRRRQQSSRTKRRARRVKPSSLVFGIFGRASNSCPPLARPSIVCPRIVSSRASSTCFRITTRHACAVPLPRHQSIFFSTASLGGRTPAEATTSSNGRNESKGPSHGVPTISRLGPLRVPFSSPLPPPHLLTRHGFDVPALVAARRPHFVGVDCVHFFRTPIRLFALPPPLPSCRLRHASRPRVDSPRHLSSAPNPPYRIPDASEPVDDPASSLPRPWYLAASPRPASRPARSSSLIFHFCGLARACLMVAQDRARSRGARITPLYGSTSRAGYPPPSRPFHVPSPRSLSTNLTRTGPSLSRALFVVALLCRFPWFSPARSCFTSALSLSPPQLVSPVFLRYIIHPFRLFFGRKGLRKVRHAEKRRTRLPKSIVARHFHREGWFDGKAEEAGRNQRLSGRAIRV